MRKYRIVKRTDVFLYNDGPKRRTWFVVQERIVTCVLFWIPVWMDMKFYDYSGSKMIFDTSKAAEDYIIKLKKINDVNVGEGVA